MSNQESVSNQKSVSNQESSSKVIQLVKEKLGNQVVESEVSLGDAVIRIGREGMLDFFRILKLDTELDFNMMVSVTATDWMDEGEERFEVVYHFLSIAKCHRLRVKIWVDEEEPEVDSLVELWSGANFMEREVWDMYGIRFKGHPDLRRILMYDEFEGYPLRKDYPLQGKQPRIPLRSPEVRNTATDMVRPSLVQIGASKKERGNAKEVR